MKDIENKTNTGKDLYEGCDESCFLYTLSLIGGKWKMIILYAIHRNGTIRYNALQRSIGNITYKTLSVQLKELEADGIVQRKLYPVVPPKTEYSLTERGKTLIPAIIELNKWGLSYLKEMNIPCRYKEQNNGAEKI